MRTARDLCSGDASTLGELTQHQDIVPESATEVLIAASGLSIVCGLERD